MPAHFLTAFRSVCMAVLIGLLLADSTKATAVASTAYVAFLCNEAMLLPILVLIRSLKVNQGRTKSDICIMVTDGVPKKGRQAIQAEGAKIIDAPETPYPYEVTEKRKKMAKQCRYAKMHLWGLTQYKRIVYLDADTMVVGTIQELFSMKLPRGPIPNGGTGPNDKYTGVLAAHDRFAGIFNSGVMVLEPSKVVIGHMLEVYMDIKSYNLGDQGFLNVFWKDANTLLEGKYNYLTWLALSTWGKSILNDRRVMHYTAEVKPWNFLDWQTSSQEFFGHLYVANIWQEWVQVADNVQQTTLSSSSPRLLVGTRDAVCADPKTIKHYSDRKFKKNDKTLTVILKANLAHGAGTAQRNGLLDRLKTYLKFQEVSEVIVVWPSRAGLVPMELTQGKMSWMNGKKVSVHTATQLGNAIFFPHMITTAFVLVAAQSIALSQDALSSMFRSATTVPGQTVGPFVYSVDAQAAASDLSGYHSKAPTSYSMVDTNMAIIKTDYLFLYTCIVDLQLLHVVDMVGECEDLLMNVVASSVSEYPPLHLTLDAGGIADRPTNARSRVLARCASKFKQTLNTDTLNLRSSRASLKLE